MHSPPDNHRDSGVKATTDYPTEPFNHADLVPSQADVAATDTASGGFSLASIFAWKPDAITGKFTTTSHPSIAWRLPVRNPVAFFRTLLQRIPFFLTLLRDIGRIAKCGRHIPIRYLRSVGPLSRKCVMKNHQLRKQQLWMLVTLVVMSAFSLSNMAAGDDQVRTWKDKTGQFEVEAKLLKFADNSVVLLKKDGRAITVPLTALSEADQKFLKETMSKPAVNPFAGGVPAANGNLLMDNSKGERASC